MFHILQHTARVSLITYTDIDKLVTILLVLKLKSESKVKSLLRQGFYDSYNYTFLWPDFFLNERPFHVYNVSLFLIQPGTISVLKMSSARPDVQK